MASTNFIDNQTIIYASWLNDVNNLTYNGQLASSIINSSTLALQTGGINAVTIDASQNVSIGKLVVSGSITAPVGLTITGTVLSDKYVANYGIYENKKAITANYSISSGNNAMSSGPITVNSGVTVTVPSGSRWVVL
jgi:hypothetical protein